MGPEMEYHLRAIFFAGACTLASFWFHEEHPNGVWGDVFGVFALHWVGALALLWWRVPNGRFDQLIQQIKRLVRRGTDDNGAK